jgi:RNA-directed DNA polymerase
VDGAAAEAGEDMVCQLPQERFDFQGYTVRGCYSATTGRGLSEYVTVEEEPSRINDAIHKCTDQRTTCREADASASQINGEPIGWANYFSLGPVSKAYHAVEECIKHRLRR